MKQLFLFLAVFVCMNVAGKEKFPDGTPIPDWFYQYDAVDVAKLGQTYRITDYGVVDNDSNLVQTEAIQAVIDKASAQGGGVIVIPRGTFLSGSLFFKPGTHLHLEEGGVLKGSDDISNFAIVDTRIEGQSLKYFAALVNADGVDGFTITGKGYDQRQRPALLEIVLAAPQGHSQVHQHGRAASAPRLHLQL